MYFPGNYRWSAAFVNMLGRASYGGADIGELHKIGRLLVPYALLVLLAASGTLAVTSWFYAVVFACQVVFYGLAAYGAALEWHGLRRREVSHA